jgi:hypothetical protein
MGRLGILSDVRKPTRQYNDNTNPPPLAIVRKLDYAIWQGPNGDELVFYYSDYAPNKRIRSKQEFLALLTSVSTSDADFVGLPSLPQGSYDSPLTLDSKGVLTYVILKLSDRYWQFARTGRPITIGARGDGARAYYNATRVDAHGTPDPTPNTDKDDHKVAYFIVDGRQIPAPYPYPHPFNLHVDLRFTGGSGRLPIVIDPDIRHPGGSLELDDGSGPPPPPPPPPIEGEGVDR